jgi:hypothetical protein
MSARVKDPLLDRCSPWLAGRPDEGPIRRPERGE